MLSRRAFLCAAAALTIVPLPTARAAAASVTLTPGPASLPVRAIVAWVAAIAEDEGFAVNPRKTRSLGAAQRQSVCGIVVNGHPNLPRDEFDRLKATLHRCVVDGPAGQNRDGHADWRGHLQGRVAWAAQLNAAKARRLKDLLDRIDWAR